PIRAPCQDKCSDRTAFSSWWGSTIVCKSGRAYTLGYQTVRLFVLYLAHFHIDRMAVQSPAEVWKSAGVTGDELSNILHVVAHVVSTVNVNALAGEPLNITEYDGSDIHRIVTAVEKLHGHIHGV
ncbi:MAG: hypothetical protein ACKN9W_06875, partial [Methylococcus sp.]